MAIYLTQDDIDTMITSAKCCAGNLGYNINKEFRYGLSCAKNNLEKLLLLDALIHVLECYIPLDPDDPDTTLNCISEEDAQILFERISRICKTCFDPPSEENIN